MRGGPNLNEVFVGWTPTHGVRTYHSHDYIVPLAKGAIILTGPQCK